MRKWAPDPCASRKDKLDESERVQDVRHVLPGGVDAVAHDVNVVAASELERAAGAPLLREAREHRATLGIDDLSGELRPCRAGAEAAEVALGARTGAEVFDLPADD